MRIDVWSDVVCPWCYIGKRRLEQALAENGDQAEIVWHSFQLDPSATNDDPRDLPTRLGEKYGRGREWGVQANAHVTGIAAELGLDYHLDQAKSANTVDAHRLLHLARELADAGQVPADTQARLKERLLKAYFTDGLPAGDHATLAGLAEETGLPSDRVAERPRRYDVHRRGGRGPGPGARVRRQRRAVLRDRRKVRRERRTACGGLPRGAPARERGSQAGHRDQQPGRDRRRRLRTGRLPDLSLNG